MWARGGGGAEREGTGTRAASGARAGAADLRKGCAGGDRLRVDPQLDGSHAQRPAIGVPAPGLAGESHHRRRVPGGCMPAPPWRGRRRVPHDHEHPAPPGELAAGSRHVRGAGIVPAGDGMRSHRVRRRGLPGRRGSSRPACRRRYRRRGCRGGQPGPSGASISLRHVRHRRARESRDADLRMERGGRCTSHRGLRHLQGSCARTMQGSRRRGEIDPQVIGYRTPMQLDCRSPCWQTSEP